MHTTKTLSHRDVKPHNMLVASCPRAAGGGDMETGGGLQSYRTLLMDFGSAGPRCEMWDRSLT